MTEGSEYAGKAEPTLEERSLCATARIQVPPDCPLLQIDQLIHDVNIQYAGGICHIEALVGDGCASVVFAEHQMDATCLGPVFQAARCYPKIRTVDRDRLSVRLVLPDRDALSTIVDGVRERGLAINVVQLSVLGKRTGETKSVVLDLAILTEKEREALELAVERGYFSAPRAEGLEDLAREFDISDSALSYRLRSAQAKIINSLFSCCDKS